MISDTTDVFIGRVDDRISLLCADLPFANRLVVVFVQMILYIITRKDFGGMHMLCSCFDHFPCA